MKKIQYLIKFIPDWVEVFFDGVAAISDTSNTDLDIRVALSLHHAPHEVVLGYKVLGLHKMDAQDSLWRENKGQMFMQFVQDAGWIQSLFVLYLSCEVRVWRGVLWSRW